MLELTLWVADVVDNDDRNHPDGEQRGRVQIKVDAFMDGFDPAHYPWAHPVVIGTGGTLTHGSSYTPEVNSKVWVAFEDPKTKKHPFFLGDVQLKNFNPAKLFEDNVKGNIKTANFDLDYPYVKFRLQANGVCEFVSSDPDNPFWGVYHPTGSQIVINPAGEIFTGKSNSALDPVVSTLKLKNYLALIKGNLGALLFTDIFDADISFADFFAGIDAGTVPVELPPVPEPTEFEDVTTPDNPDDP